jgi:hypothetical protein
MTVRNIEMYLYGRRRCSAVCIVQRRLVDIVGEHSTSTSGDRKFCRTAYWCPDCSRNVLFSYYTCKEHPTSMVVIESDVRNSVVIQHSWGTFLVVMSLSTYAEVVRQTRPVLYGL